MSTQNKRFFRMTIHYKTLYPPYTVPEPIPMNSIYTFLFLYSGKNVERVELMEIEPAVLQEVKQDEKPVLCPTNNGQAPNQTTSSPS